MDFHGLMDSLIERYNTRGRSSACFTAVYDFDEALADRIFNDWCNDSNYQHNTLDQYVRDKHPDVWEKILPELTAKRLVE